MRQRIRHILLTALLLLAGASARAQFLDSTTGLLQMPTAVMNPEGTFMITANYLNQHATPTRWDYDTFGYGFDVALWNRVEIAYVCTLLYGRIKETIPDAGYDYFYYRNQDRHFSAKLLVLREGEFGKEWIPALAVGVVDPFTGGTLHDYLTPLQSDNKTFQRYYAVATKHFNTSFGEIGAHLGYQFNRHYYYPLHSPCAGVDWKPVWLQTNWLSLDLVAEYDSRTFNIGFIASLWGDRFEAMFDLQALKWVSVGLRYKMFLRN